MADAILSVGLEAQVTNFRNGMQTAAQEATRTGQAVLTATSSISQNVARVNSVNLNGFRASLQAGQISLGRLNTTAAATATSLRPLTTGSNQAGQALTNLGRVAQDAPFGFIGIQNNLNPLLESFQRLRTESGSNGAALRALGQSLIGPAGLGIALSVVTSAITFYTMYQQKANKAAKEAAETNKNYEDSLDGVQKALLLGAINAERELVPLRTLYEATQNLNLSTADRVKAANELQKQFPATFKALSDEAILAGKAAEQYDKLTASILAKAKAGSLQKELEDNAKILRTLETREELNKKAAADAVIREKLDFAIKSKNLAQIEFLRKQLAKTGDIFDVNPEAIVKGAEGAASVIKDVNALNIDAVSIQLQKNKAARDGNKLAEALKGIVETNGVEAIVPDSSVDDTKSKVKSLADILKELETALKVNEAQYNATFDEKNTGKISAYQSAIDSLITNGYNPAADAVKRLREEQQKLFQLEAGSTTSLEEALNKRRKSQVADPKLVGKASKGVITPTGSSITRIQAEQEAILKSQQRFNQDMDALVVDGVAGTISNIGSAIGEALMAGGDIFSAAGGALLAGFGQFLDQFGKLLVEYGAAAVLKSKLDAAILIPGAGIFAGAAAIAAGIALQIAAGAIGSLASGKSQGGNKGKNSQPTAFANGGVVFGPTNALIGEYAGARNNPEVVAPLSKLKSMIGNNAPYYEVIPIANSQQLSILVRNGDRLLNRVR